MSSHGTESKYTPLFSLPTKKSQHKHIRLASYVPYKYAMEKFVHVGSIQRDHIDPSIFCVLTARSKTPGAPLADFLIFSGRWDVASGTFRPPVRTSARPATRG